MTIRPPTYPPPITADDPDRVEMMVAWFLANYAPPVEGADALPLAEPRRELAWVFAQLAAEDIERAAERLAERWPGGWAPSPDRLEEREVTITGPAPAPPGFDVPSSAAPPPASGPETPSPKAAAGKPVSLLPIAVLLLLLAATVAWAFA